jgi:hypothetical protein
MRREGVGIEWRFNWFRNQSPGSRARSKIGRNYTKRIRPIDSNRIGGHFASAFGESLVWVAPN